MLDDTRPDDVTPRIAGWILGALLVVAAALRFQQLGADLWFDEYDTLVRYARRPLGTIVTTYDSQNQHFLYSITARVAVVLFGDSAWAIRLPAALFGIASVWATYWFGTQVTTRRESLIAAALLTFSYHHVWFSQNARGYTGLLFFALLGSGLFVQLLRAPAGRGRILAYAVAMALGVYIHLTAAIVAVAHLVIWGGVYLSGQADDPPRRDWRPAAAVALAGLLSIALYGPVLDQLLGTLMKPMVRLSSDLKWTSPRWLVSEMIFGLARGVPGGIVGLALGGLVILAGIVDYARQSRALIGTLLLPPILLAVVILLARHNLWPRFFFFAAGFGALIAVRGLFVACRLVLPRRATSVATVVAVILALASATRVPAAWGPKQRYGAAWSYVEAERGPDDAVVTLLMSDAPYLDRSGVEEIYSDNLARLDNLEERHDRIWVIYSFPPTVQAVLPGIWERLQTDYRRAAAFPGSVRDGEVVVMVKG